MRSNIVLYVAMIFLFSVLFSGSVRAGQDLHYNENMMQDLFPYSQSMLLESTAPKTPFRVNTRWNDGKDVDKDTVTFLGEYLLTPGVSAEVNLDVPKGLFAPEAVPSQTPQSVFDTVGLGLRYADDRFVERGFVFLHGIGVKVPSSAAGTGIRGENDLSYSATVRIWL